MNQTNTSRTVSRLSTPATWRSSDTKLAASLTALGIANFSQANRVLLRQLDKSTKGNLYVQFVTSFRALKVRPGDIITLTYLKEGFIRVPFRVMKLSPSANYEMVTIVGQIHDDNWYSDNPAVLGGAGRQQISQIQTPKPLIGVVAHDDAHGNLEFFDFQVQENIYALKDGTATDTLSVSFSVPSKPDANSPNLPLLSLSPNYSNTNGTLPGGSSFYYAVSAVDSAGNEGTLSFTVPATIPDGPNTNQVTIQQLSFPVTAVFVQRLSGKHAANALPHRVSLAISCSIHRFRLLGIADRSTRSEL